MPDVAFYEAAARGTRKLRIAHMFALDVFCSMPSRGLTGSQSRFRQRAIGITRTPDVVGLARFVILLFALVGDEVLVLVGA